MRVVTHSMKDRDSVALGFLVGVGGRYENNQNKGAVHFLEHVLFKGSQKYSCDEIKQQIEGVGGSLNAFTGEEHTCFYAKIPARFVSRTIAILGDMIFSPLLAPKDVEKEKAVIVEEIKMYHDLPQYYVLELLEELLWPDHPLGKSLTGTPESIGRMGHQDLRRFHDQYYRPGNIVIGACGNVGHRDFVNMVKHWFPAHQPPLTLGFLKARNVPTRPQTRFFYKKIEQMHLALGVLAYDIHHKDKYALHLLNIILGGNMSSRLFDVIREKKGLAYSISSGVKNLSDTGVFIVKAGVLNTKIVESVDLILKELNKIKRFGVTADEFGRAKDYYLGQVLLGLEDTLDHMLWLADHLMSFNCIMTLKDLVTKVKRVTRHDIMRVANDIFRKERFKLAMVGPLENKDKSRLQELVGFEPGSIFPKRGHD